MAVDAWEVAQKEVDMLPPYLTDDELTVDRLAERNKGALTKTDAQTLLDKLVEQGRLIKSERRNPRGGSHMWAYIVPNKKTPLAANK